MISFIGWPEVPEALRPKKLYISSGIKDIERGILVELGWEPIDVRLLETSTDAQRQVAIMAWLEGVRLGSIEASNTAAKYVELEMRACGLHSGGSETKVAELPSEDLDVLLDFGKVRV